MAPGGPSDPESTHRPGATWRRGAKREGDRACHAETARKVQNGRDSTHLPTAENMVPNGSASKVDVEVSETTFHAHQTVPAAQKQGSRKKTIQCLNHRR